MTNDQGQDAPGLQETLVTCQQLALDAGDEIEKYLKQRQISLSGAEEHALGRYFAHCIRHDDTIRGSYWSGKSREAGRLAVDMWLKLPVAERTNFALMDEVADAADRLSLSLGGKPDEAVMHANVEGTEFVLILARGASARAATELYKVLFWPPARTQKTQ